MKLVITTYARGNVQASLIATPKQVKELNYCLNTIRINQNTHGDDDLDKLSVGAYKSLKALFEIIGV